MKKINSIKYLLVAFLFGAAVTACDKFENDVPPARMASLILHDDHYTTLKNHGLQLHVLANDSIGSTATLQFSQPQNGFIQTDSVGNVYYQPVPNFTGTDAFTYKACLGNDCATANVTINVQNDSTSNCTIQAFDDIFTLLNGTHDSIPVLLNDNLCGVSPANTLVSISQQPAHGYAFVTSTNHIRFAANANYSGPDELTYQITNSKGTSTAKVRYTINSTQCKVL